MTCGKATRRWMSQPRYAHRHMKLSFGRRNSLFKGTTLEFIKEVLFEYISIVCLRHLPQGRVTFDPGLTFLHYVKDTYMTIIYSAGFFAYCLILQFFSRIFNFHS